MTGPTAEDRMTGVLRWVVWFVALATVVLAALVAVILFRMNSA